MKKDFLLFFLILGIFSLNVSGSTLKIIIQGPLQVLVNYSNGSILLINNSSVIKFNDSIKVTVVPLNPSYYLVVNGTKYFSLYSAVINESETLYIKALPEYVKVYLNLNGSGKLNIMINNGSIFTVNKSTSFLVLNNSMIYITSGKSFEVNGITTNFYIFIPTSNVTLNITFVSQRGINAPPPKITSQDLLGISLGLIGLSLYLFFKRKKS